MSKEIDERVVEMRFDNKQFEENVRTSMSTLDKLKQKLNLSGASKGLEDVESAAKKVDMSGLGKGIETVQMKFSALQVMGVTALANITNSAVNAGERMISALTIDPIKSGFEEYETQMNAVQTILANTQKEGTNVKIVNKYLDELNTYADKTIYNFTEMTRNIGTFTAAGVKLETSVSSIKGIANLAAVSGSNSQQASTAMYQLSQAIASGTVKLMDWNSVVNAGMGGQVFQDALVRTSEHLQTGAKAAIAAEGSFRESLSTGWLTTEVLTETLDQFATAADTQEEYEAAVKKFVEQGYSQEEAKQMADMAKTAGDAATKVKTFTQLIDTLKEALGSGWTKTWQLIIGDFEESREMWTKVSDVLGGFINKMSDARNTLLESALGKGFTSLTEKIEKILTPAKKAAETIDKTVEAVSNLGDVVDDVILGKFGEGKDRFDLLTESGLNYYKVQNKVNETLGNSFRYTDEQIEAQDKLLGVQDKSIDETKKETKETEKLTDEKKNLIKKVASMTEEQMRSKGYTNEQIEAFKELSATADKLGMPLDEFIDNMDKINGRWLLMHSFENIGKNLISIFKSIGSAWKEIFEPMSSNDLFNVIAGFHKFTESIKLTKEQTENLKRTFKGLFAALDIVKTIVGGGFHVAFKAISAVLSAFDMDILELTGNIGDVIVKFRDFLFDNDLITKSFELMAEGVKIAIAALKDLYEYIKSLPKVQKIIESIKNIDLSEVGKNILDGLRNGLEEGITSIPQILFEIGKKLLSSIKEVLGIHSPSTEMYDIGQNAMAGLINGLKDGAGNVWEVISGIGNKMLTQIKEFDWDKAFALGVSVALLATVKKMVGILDNITAPLAGIGDVLSGAGSILSSVSKVIDKSARSIKKVIKSFSNVLNAKAFQMKAEAIRNIAISIAILAGSIYLLAQLDYGKLWSAVGAVVVLSAVLVALAVAMDKLTSSSTSIDRNGINFKGLKLALINIGIALLLIAATVKVMGGMNPDEMKRGFIGLAGLVAAIAAVFASFGLLVKGKSAQNIDKAGKMIRKMAVTLLLLVGVVKLVGTLSKEEMLKGAAFAAAFLVFVTALNAASILAGKNIHKIGSTILKISLAMALMVGVCKLAGNLSEEEMLKGAAFAAAFLVFVDVLVDITKIGKDEQITKLGGLLFSISTAMLLMVGVVKLVGKLKPEEMLKGAVFAGAFLVFVWALIEITKVEPEEQIAKVAGTVLAMSVAIGIMAGVCILLGLINLKDLAKGVAAVSMLGAIMALMIKATKDANDVKGSILTMSVAIAVMAVAVAALSFIDPTKLAGATAALSVLMGMFALIAKASNDLNGSMRSLIVMTVAIGLLAGIIFLLSKLQVESVLGVSASLSVLLLSMSACCSILSAVGMTGAAAFVGVAALVTLVTAVGGLIIAIGSLAEHFPKMEEFLNKGIPILEKIGYALGSFFGNIIGGFTTGITSGLPDMATNLSTFMTNLQPFINGVKQVDETSLTGVKSLVKMIALISGANILEKISSWLTGSSSMETFATQLDSFANAIISFSNKVSGNIDESSVMAAANAGKMMAEMQQSIVPSGGVVQWFSGEKDMTAFGTQLVAFGNAIVAFSNKVSEGVNEEAVTAAANAGKIMAEMQNSIVPSGGVVQWFSGEKDMTTFGNQLVAFGDAIIAFSNKVSEGVNEEAVTAAASAGDIMLTMQSKLIPTGGVVQWFNGEKDMATFGTQLKVFGEAITTFSENTHVDSEAVESAAHAGEIMATLQKSIPESHWLDGKVTLDEFGSDIVKFGEGIKKYSEKVSGMDSESVSSSLISARKLVNLTRDITDLDTSGISEFEGVKSIGKTISAYAENVSSIDNNAISSSITSATRLASFINHLANIDTSGVSSFKKAVNSLAKTNIEELAKAFSGSTSKLVSIGAKITEALVKGFSSKSMLLTNAAIKAIESMNKAIISRSSAFKNSGMMIMEHFINGIVSQRGQLTSSLSNTVSSAVVGIRNYYTSFYYAGSYLVEGFANGISSNTFKATAKAQAMASAALEAAKEVLKEHSPSKAFYEVGDYAGQGFVNALDDNIRTSYKAGSRLATSAKKGLGDAITKVGDMINGNIDTEPTIRPVLDLSDVKTGIDAVGDLFNDRASIGVMTNVNAVSSMMRKHNQNGGNDDVVYAINKLRKDLGNISGPSYTVNGVTYDDGSNVSEAVKSLIRAARVERRV